MVTEDQIEIPATVLKALGEEFDLGMMPLSVKSSMVRVAQIIFLSLANDPVVPMLSKDIDALWAMEQINYASADPRATHVQEIQKEWQRRAFLKPVTKFSPEVERWIDMSIAMGIEESVVREAAKKRVTL